MQLTRMEGILNLITERGAMTTKIVEQHSEDIGMLKSTTQRLSEQSASREATQVALAAALKDADETRRIKSENSWTPWMRFFATIAATVGIITIIVLFKP